MRIPAGFNPRNLAMVDGWDADSPGWIKMEVVEGAYIIDVVRPSRPGALMLERMSWARTLAAENGLEFPLELRTVGTYEDAVRLTGDRRMWLVKGMLPAQETRYTLLPGADKPMTGVIAAYDLLGTRYQVELPNGELVLVDNHSLDPGRAPRGEVILLYSRPGRGYWTMGERP